MKYMMDAYIDWFLEQHQGNHRQAMAWLIGRMNASECDLKEIHKVTYHPRADDWTTIEYIELELDKKEEDK